MRTFKIISAGVVLVLLIGAKANAQQKQMSDSEYMAQALSAAPQGVAKDAAVAREGKNGSMRTLRAGNNVYVHDHGHGQDV